MRLTKSIAGCIILTPLVSGFTKKGIGFRQKKVLQLGAAGGDVPGVVKAYQKAQPAAASLPQASLPDPVVAPVEPVSSVLPDEARSSISDAIGTKFQFANDFLKSTQEVAQQRQQAGIAAQQVRAAAASNDGGAPTLAEMLLKNTPTRATVTESASVDFSQAERLAEAKSKAGLIVSNMYNLFGVEPPKDGILPDGLSLPDALQNLPDGFVYGALGVVAFFILIGSRNSAVADTKSTMGEMVAKEAGVVSELAVEVKSMGSDLENLNKETGSLRNELQSAKTKLTQKELEISKERLKVADRELQLNREIEKLQAKLKESNSKVTLMENDLKETQLVRDKLSAALEKVKGETGVSGSSSVEELKRVVKGQEVAVDDEPFFAGDGPKKAPARKKAPAKKKAATKGAAKKVSTKAKAPAKKKATTKAPAKKAAAKTSTGPSDPQDWSTLAPSVLERKTVKVLSEYLEGKGVPTKGEDGKPMKKALLVEAVRSL